MEKNKFFEGPLGKYLLPPIILQSVLIGGGYATGREIVEYGAKYGALGWIGGLGIFIGFAVISVLVFELARTFHVYDYKNIMKKIIGKLWPIYDVLYVLIAILIIAVMSSAAGEILLDTLGIPYFVGIGIVIVIVGIVLFYGERFIERFKTYGTSALYIGYIIFAATVILTRWDEMIETFATGDTAYMGEISLGPVLFTGILYVGYNLAVYPASYFTLRRQTTRKETVLSGIIAGALMVVPWFLTYFAIMGFYPDPEVLEAPVPWLVMLADTHFILIGLFGIVMGWTLVETSTGIIHGFLSRVDENLKEIGKGRMTAAQRSVASIVILVLAMLLSRVGIIDLVAMGYTYMAYGFIIFFALPLLVIGTFRILNPKWTNEFFGD